MIGNSGLERVYMRRAEKVDFLSLGSALIGYKDIDSMKAWLIIHGAILGLKPKCSWETLDLHPLHAIKGLKSILGIEHMF